MAASPSYARPGIVAIDLHRGHLDPAVATMPLDGDAAARVVAANARFFAWARAAGIPIFHCVATYRDSDEIVSNPAWRARAADPNNPRKNVLKHNIKGMPGCEVMPQLLDPSDFIIDAKKRYDCFIATDLDLSLRSHGVDTVLITGVNTNSCVMATAAAACCRDYAVVAVTDCVDTMDGPELHAAALRVIATAFGEAATADAIMVRFTPPQQTGPA
ncbi:MAG: isochorismatase family protein [Rhodopseudomonas sp.]|nr:isochorismatase family protein [Rhodopseudomonas sp.]